MRCWSFTMVAVMSGVFLLVACRVQEAPAGQDGLDYGLYWFGPDNASQKAGAGEPNPYFDLSKPTIIFVHGWKPDEAGEPTTFDFQYMDESGEVVQDIDLARAWIEDGWNVGMFYWHQFADEDQVWAAEDKIWTPDGERGMRWRTADGAYHTEGAPTVSAAELFYQAYTQSMAGYTGPEIRIAGHSLGNQMAIRLVLMILDGIERGDLDSAILPTRVALLDPFWSPLSKDYLDGRQTDDLIQLGIREAILPREILVEWYHSSLLTEETFLGEGLTSLREQVAYTELHPDFCEPVDQVCRHNAAWQVYFLSYGATPPLECAYNATTETCEPTGRAAASASTSNERLAEMMAEPYTWSQVPSADGVDGRLTPSTDDDWYERISANASEQ